MINLKDLTIIKAHEAMKKGEFTSVELTQTYLEEIAKKNKEINAYLEVFPDALDEAKKADDKFRAGTATLLTGIPCAIKDNILIKDKIASSASKMLENYHATYDATVIAKLREEGAVFLGRTNMDEFAMGGSTENSAFGPTRNPHDTSRVAGGSSGGSVAAIAMDGALFALGSDTGGSIRQPASLCGVVGLKATYGAISRYGAMAMAASLNQIAPAAKTVTDTEIVFNAIKGVDPKDAQSLQGSNILQNGASENIITQKNTDIQKKKVIGVPRHFLTGDGIDLAVLNAFNNALVKFEKLGYEIREIELPNISYSLMVYYIIMPAEVSSDMARFDGVRYGLYANGKNGIEDYFESRGLGLGREVKRRILLGTYVLSSGYYDAYYNRANAVRRMITEDFQKAFQTVDVIATPTAPSPAFKIGEKNNDPVSMYLEDIFTVTANLTGMPAISIPNGFVEREGKQLPIGLQLSATHGAENILFETGKVFLGEK